MLQQVELVLPYYSCTNDNSSSYEIVAIDTRDEQRRIKYMALDKTCYDDREDYDDHVDY